MQLLADKYQHDSIILPPERKLQQQHCQKSKSFVSLQKRICKTCVPFSQTNIL